MNIKVKVNDQLYDVEVGDLRSRPIIVVIDGETIEVWPETDRISYASTVRVLNREIERGKQPLTSITEQTKQDPMPTTASETSDKLKIVKAPIPGVITLIAVQVGNEVAVGQELCKLEAMKMNNSIRASRAGIIATVNISIGQQVKHGDVLFEYSV